jgi:thiaminase
MLMILNKILTDETIIATAGSIIVALGGIVVSLIVWIFNKVLKEIKDGNVKRDEAHDYLKNKFRYLNNYARQTDKVQYMHNSQIMDLRKDTDNLKKRVDQHSNILRDNRLQEHEKPKRDEK